MNILIGQLTRPAGGNRWDRTPPPSKPPHVVPPKDDTIRDAVPGDSSAVRLRLQRIVDALQVPSSALYDLTSAASPASSPGGGSVALDADMEGECRALLRAYRRINNPEDRHRLLALVHSMGERN